MPEQHPSVGAAHLFSEVGGEETSAMRFSPAEGTDCAGSGCTRKRREHFPCPHKSVVSSLFLQEDTMMEVQSRSSTLHSAPWRTLPGMARSVAREAHLLRCGS